MEYILLYIVGFFLTSFMIKIFNKYTIREEYKIDGHIGFFISLTGLLGIFFLLMYFLFVLIHKIVKSPIFDNFIEKYKKWVEGE